MPKKGPQVVKFATTNKAQIRGPIGHSRTGACTSRGKCQHGRKPQRQGSWKKA